MADFIDVELPWDSQPQEAAEPDWSQAVTRDLVLLINPGAGFVDSVRQRAVTRNGISISAGQAGLAFDAASNASAGAQFAGSRMSTSDGAGTGDFSVLVIGNPVASATREMLFSITNGPTEFYFAVNSTIGLTASSGLVSPQTNAGGAVGVSQTGGADGAMHAWLYVREAVAQDFGYLYRDGVLVGSGPLGSPNASMWSAASTDNVGGWSGANWGVSQSVLLVAGWNRVVSASEAADLTRSAINAWQLFAPEAIPVPVPAGGGGTSISGALGTAVASGFTGNVNANRTIAGALGTASATGLQGNVNANRTIAGALGVAVASGLAGNVNANRTIAGALGTAVASGLQGTVSNSNNTVIAGNLGVAVASGLAANVNANTTIAGNIGVAVASGFSGSVLNGGGQPELQHHGAWGAPLSQDKLRQMELESEAEMIEIIAMLCGAGVIA